jgi:hypothetical protein
VNVTSWYSPSIISMYKKNLDYWFRTICNLLQIICQTYLLTVLYISQSYCARKSGGTIFKTTQLPIRGGKYGHKKDRGLTPYGYSLSKAYGCLPSKRPALCTHISGAQSLEHPNSVIMGSDMEFKG